MVGVMNDSNEKSKSRAKKPRSATGA